MKYLTFCYYLIACLPLFGQSGTPQSLLLGRWEVLGYSEQGVQVDKRQPALPQAQQVYKHVSSERTRQWYGWFDTGNQTRREEKAFERWLERDSSMEVRRVAEAIATPYFAIFYADSTLALHNKDAATRQVYFPEVRQYVFLPATMTLELRPVQVHYSGGHYPSEPRSKIQVLELTATRMRLFIPEEGEVVVLERTASQEP